MALKNIIQLGATGTVGRPVFEALVASTKFNITVGTRDASIGSFPVDVKVVQVDYLSHQSLVDAFKGQDAVVITLGTSSNIALMEKIEVSIIDAAVSAGVSHIIPSNYGGDFVTHRVSVMEPKIRTEEYLARLASQGKINFTPIATGPFFDWGLTTGFIGIDLVTKKAVLMDNGDRKVNVTNVPTIAAAVVAVLSTPDLAMNRLAKIHDLFVSQRDILQAIEQELGAKFEVTHISSEDLNSKYEAGLAHWDPTSVFALIRAAAWGPNSPCAWGVDDDSKALGLSSKDLKEEVSKIITGDMQYSTWSRGLRVSSDQ
ncbi:hypothetical protein C8J56DRAFT_212082 [Mycena floridula]|nr:hypothetical protein C8J56DRAFT_212082 [Mycena floridula]